MGAAQGWSGASLPGLALVPSTSRWQVLPAAPARSPGTQEPVSAAASVACRQEVPPPLPPLHTAAVCLIASLSTPLRSQMNFVEMLREMSQQQAGAAKRCSTPGLTTTTAPTSSLQPLAERPFHTKQ